jgi:hypothetical protein
LVEKISVTKFAVAAYVLISDPEEGGKKFLETLFDT